MTQKLTSSIGAAVLLFAALALSAPVTEFTAVHAQGQQPTQLDVKLKDGTKRLAMAVADFVVVGGTDAETTALAKSVPDVLWADMDFEREYFMVPRAKTAAFGAPKTAEEVAKQDWGATGAGADVVMIGTITRSGSEFSVNIKLVGSKGEASTFSPLYEHCIIRNPRYCAHSIADDVHKRQRNLDGVARTRMAFSSDRDAARMANRTSGVPAGAKEIYISDYDGANQQRFTFDNSLNIHSRWAPNGNQIVFTSYRTNFPDIYVADLAQAGRGLKRPGAGTDRVQNHSAAFSPDGTKIAYVSNRSGNYDIWIVNVDGSGAFNLTNHPSSDMNPTWSPNGQQLAFTSDRATGSTPQLYVIGTSGQSVERLTDVRADRPTWSRLDFIAFTAGGGPGHDIGLLDLATRQVSILTDGRGDNGSPTVSPSGRHIAFTTTRWGKEQIAIIDRRGENVRQITTTGNNTYSSWQPIGR